MAIAVTHNVVVATANDAGYEVSKNAWNDGHALSMATSRVLGRTTAGTGAAEELKGMWVEVSRATASSSATIDFTGIDSTADEWLLSIINAVPATDGGQLDLRTSSNGGSSYDSSASDYTSVALFTDQTAPFTDYAATDTKFRLGVLNAGNASNETGVQANIRITTPSLAQYCVLYAEVCIVDDAGAPCFGFVSGRRNSAADVDAVRVYFDTGNITSGTFVLYKRLK
jgi:hypothetical protein